VLDLVWALVLALSGAMGGGRRLDLFGVLVLSFAAHHQRCSGVSTTFVVGLKTHFTFQIAWRAPAPDLVAATTRVLFPPESCCDAGRAVLSFANIRPGANPSSAAKLV